MNSNSEWTVSQELLAYICGLMPEGGTILELGSGHSTYIFDKIGYKVLTIEHDPDYLNKVPGVTYIHAPIEYYSDKYQQLPSIKKRINGHTGWYNRQTVGEALMHCHYDCIMVDGPPNEFGRSGFLSNLGLFPDLSVPIIFDDVHRIDDLFIAERVARELGRDLLVTNNGKDKKPFGIVLL
jgi:hypothetical protein